MERRLVVPAARGHQLSPQRRDRLGRRNKGFHAKLPAQAKTAFEKNAGYAASKAFGVVIDAVAVDQFDTVKAMPGHTQAYLAPEEKARWRALFTPITDEWVKATPNGAAILAAYRDAILKVRAGS
jgi:hypothetical protein